MNRSADFHQPPVLLVYARPSISVDCDDAGIATDFCQNMRAVKFSVEAAPSGVRGEYFAWKASRPRFIKRGNAEGIVEMPLPLPVAHSIELIEHQKGQLDLTQSEAGVVVKSIPCVQNGSACKVSALGPQLSNACHASEGSCALHLADNQTCAWTEVNAVAETSESEQVGDSVKAIRMPRSTSDQRLGSRRSY